MLTFLKRIGYGVLAVAIIAVAAPSIWFGGENSGSGTKGVSLSDAVIGTRAVAQGFNIPNNSSVLGHLLAGLAPGSAPPVITNGTLIAGSTDWVGAATATAPGTLVVTFGTAFTAAPICLVNNQTTSSTTRPTWSASTTALTVVGGFTASDRVNWTCVGAQR